MNDFTELMERVEKITGHKLPDAAHAVIGKYISDIIRRDQEHLTRLQSQVDGYKQRDDDHRAEILRHAATNAKLEERIKHLAAQSQEYSAEDLLRDGGAWEAITGEK